MVKNVMTLTKNQRFSHPILGGLFSALLFVFLGRVIGDLAATFSLIPLFVVALQHKDIKALGPALGVALLNVVVLSMMLQMGLEQALSYMLYVAAPGLILPRLAMQFKQQSRKKIWYPLDRLSGALGLYALITALILAFIWHVMGAGPKALEVMVEVLQKSPLEAQDRIQILLKYLKTLWPYVPGISMGLFTLMVSIATSLTQKWFKHNNVKFPRSPLCLSDLYLPWWCWKAFAGVGVAWAVTLQTETVVLQYLFGNLTLPLVALFLLQGFAIVTSFAKKQKNPKMFLVIFYGFVVVFGWTLLILILGGLLEPWLDLRTRLQTKEKE